MAGRGGQRKNVLLPPINYVFKLMQNKTPVKVWLFQDTSFKIEGNVMVRKDLGERPICCEG